MDIGIIEDVVLRMLRDNIRLTVEINPSSYDHSIMVEVDIIDSNGSVYASHREFADIPGPRGCQ